MTSFGPRSRCTGECGLESCGLWGDNLAGGGTTSGGGGNNLRVVFIDEFLAAIPIPRSTRNSQRMSDLA